MSGRERQVSKRYVFCFIYVLCSPAGVGFQVMGHLYMLVYVCV